jgi:3-phenylpropionate/trans-cinnamate dioxygenase ferredoxin reductase component
MPSDAGVLIVGASQAGIQLALSLRDFGYDAPITLVGSEPHLPYQRPPLSKAFLAGEVTAESLTLRNETFLAAQRITALTGEWVVEVNRATGQAVTDSGRTLGFRDLALTTGARARVLPIPGSKLRGVLSLRDIDDAVLLRESLHDAERVVVIGGGFIGLEAAATARTQGKDVTVVLLDRRLMARAVGQPMSDFFHRAHTGRGVAVHYGVMPTELRDDGRGHVAGVVLDDGSAVPADLVVVGIGVAPRTEVALGLGLDVDNGIVVDEYARCSDGVTVAAGDCVSCPDPTGVSPGRVRFESVNTAIEQAKTAAATLAGQPRPYRATPWFWSDQFNLKLQVAGLSAEHDQLVTRGDADHEKFSTLYYRSGRLIAAECVNSPADFQAVKTALGAGRTAPPEEVADVSVPLKALLRGDAAGVGARP